MNSIELSSGPSYLQEIEAFQANLNKEYRDSLKSPLKAMDRETFKALDYFPINPTFRILAKFTSKESETFKMKTTTDRAPEYRKYGELSFELEGKKYKLNLYQNIKLMQKEEYKDYLFIPFTDATNGQTSYGGGRYIDFRIPTKKIVVLDFNKAYNPYCAYNSKYSCPIPPIENDIPIAIEAGVKAWEKH